jgi:hypothetical protein
MADFGVQKPHFYHISPMHKAIQIVALQKKERSNPFNTKGTKNFLCRFSGFCVKNFGAQRPHFHLIFSNKTTSVESKRVTPQTKTSLPN